MSLNPCIEPIVGIIANTQHGEGRTAYVTYTISIKYTTNNNTIQWTVDRRYSEFVELYKSISTVLTNIPVLPEKTWYKPTDWLKTLDKIFLDHRQNELNQWLQQINKFEYVLRSIQYKQFIQFIQNVPNDINNTEFVPRQLKAEISIHTSSNGTALHHGVNSIVYLENEFIILCAAEEPGVIGRLDARLSNIKMPNTWQYIKSLRNRNTPPAEPVQSTVPTNTTEQAAPFGSFIALKMGTDAKWNVVSTIVYDSSATTIEYDNVNNIAIIGLDNGKMILYSHTNTYDNYTALNTIQAHTARITGLTCDSKRNLCVSVSRDKKISIIDTKTHAIISSTVTNFSLECIESDISNSRVFIGNVAGSIAIYDISNASEPQLLHTLHGHTNTVRALHYNATYRYLFSGSYDFTVGIWHIVSTDNINTNKQAVTRSRVVGWLKNTPSVKIKSITYCASERHVVCGLADGRLAVYNTDSGQLINCITAHANQVKYVHWINDARILLCGSLDGFVKYYKWPLAPTEEQVKQVNAALHNTTSNPLSADNQTIAQSVPSTSNQNANTSTLTSQPTVAATTTATTTSATSVTTSQSHAPTSNSTSSDTNTNANNHTEMPIVTTSTPAVTEQPKSTPVKETPKPKISKLPDSLFDTADDG